MSNEYIKPRNKVIKGYDKLSYTGQLIAEANYMSRRVEAREERSKMKKFNLFSFEGKHYPKYYFSCRKRYKF